MKEPEWGAGQSKTHKCGQMALACPPLDEGLGPWERTGEGLQPSPEGREDRISLGRSAGQERGDFLRHPPERWAQWGTKGGVAPHEMEPDLLRSPGTATLRGDG